MSTRISLSRSSTTRPRTTSPSWISPLPSRLNQSSMLSSGALSTSPCAPPRAFVFRLSGFSIFRHVLSWYLSPAPASAPTLCPYCVMLLLHQLGDGTHHFLGGFTVALLAPLVTYRLEDEGGAEGHSDAGGPGEHPSRR